MRFPYLHILTTWLLITGDSSPWKTNPYCWNSEHTHKTCCGANLNDSLCFDSQFPRQSCCNVASLRCWDSNDTYSWNKCCNLALPFGRSSCFHGDFAWGAYCCTEMKWGSLAGKKNNEDGVGAYAQVKKNGYLFNFTDTGHHEAWSLYHQYEQSTFAVFDHLLTPYIERRRAKMVWDIGGFIGQTCLYLAHLADRVLVMEPSPYAFNALVKNIRANTHTSIALNKNKIIPVNKALGEVNKNVSTSDKGDSMDRIISSDSDIVFTRKNVSGRTHQADRLLKVEMVTPEVMLRDYPVLNATEFIKVDVEGYEVAVIPALEPFLRRYKPRLLLSLHPSLLTLEQMEDMCMRLLRIFPYVYEVRYTFMVLPLDLEKLKKKKFAAGHHGGTDLLGTWNEIYVGGKEGAKRKR